MPILPPTSVYPIDYDSDRTLFKVYNTTESTISSNLNIADTTINIVPVEVTDDEIWGENGFATISGELVYYDSVTKDGNGKINTLVDCVRNLGGNPPVFNPSGTDIRGFVLAEHHNNLATSIVNLENFIGINLSEDKTTLDWRIRNLANQLELSDDYGCPQVSFIYYTLSIDPLLGTTISYNLEITGSYINFVLEFGDGTLTNSSLSGTHIYPPNSNIDPRVTVNSNVCQTVTSGVARSQPNEPLITFVPVAEGLTIDPIADFPDLQYITDPNTSADVNLPPIVFPCLDIGPFGPISIPSSIILDPPVLVPSEIVFSNIPIIASTVSISPVTIDVSTSQFVELVCIPFGSGTGAASQSSGATTGGLGYAGYFQQGFQLPNSLACVLMFATDTFRSLQINASTLNYNALTTSDITNGYFINGYTPTGGNPTFIKTISAFKFATETASILKRGDGNTDFGLNISRFDTVFPNANIKALIDSGGSNRSYRFVYPTTTTSAILSILSKTPGFYNPLTIELSQLYDKGYTANSDGIGKIYFYSTETKIAKQFENLGVYQGGSNNINGNQNYGFALYVRYKPSLSGNIGNPVRFNYANDVYSRLSTIMLGDITMNLRLPLNEGSTKGYCPVQAGKLQGFNLITGTFYYINNLLPQPNSNVGWSISHIYIQPNTTSPTPTPTLTFSAGVPETTVPNIPQFVGYSNGYKAPEEASQYANEQNFINFSNGYNLDLEKNTEDNNKNSDGLEENLKTGLLDSFKTVKLVIKQDDMKPNVDELLGD